MKVYIATSLDNRELAEQVAAMLTKLGHEITSEWHTDATNTKAKELDISNPDVMTNIARTNYAHIDAADAVIFLNHPTCRGSLTEAGYAFGKGKRVVCVHRVNGFWLDHVPVVEKTPIMLSNLNWVLPHELTVQLARAA